VHIQRRLPRVSASPISYLPSPRMSANMMYANGQVMHIA
jgi:hypothetical protein